VTRHLLRERELDVSGAGRHIDDEVIDVTPAGILHQLLRAWRHHRPRQTIGVSTSMRKRETAATPGIMSHASGISIGCPHRCRHPDGLARADGDAGLEQLVKIPAGGTSDYLIVDMPPAPETSSLTLAQKVPVTGSSSSPPRRTSRS